MSAPKPVVLCILDGWGLSDLRAGNAPALAHTPTFDRIMATCPNARLLTHGPDVGLPSGQMGNSEVGHTNIGAGRVVSMDLGQIDLAIEDGSFFENAAILDAVSQVKQAGGALHIAGVMSDGGVHGHIDHMAAAVSLAVREDVAVELHLITDGRDVAGVSALGYLEELAENLEPGVEIATLSGRYYAMDRDTRWERVKLAFDAMVRGEGKQAPTPKQAIKDAYAKEVWDEFIKPRVIGGFGGIKDGDGLFFLNFRADRAREILSAIAQPDFDGFDTGPRPRLSAVLGMVNYSDTHDTFMTTAYPKQEIPNTLGAWVAKHGLRQFRLAETEKYPHVTFFLNGGVEVPAEGEERFMPRSPDVATYDLQPEMSAPEVAARFVSAIEAGYDLIVVNFANPDMVGHTGDLDAAIAACEAVDAGLTQALAALEAAGGAMVLTADHGNCEVMVDPDTGGPHKAHTLNLVPVALIGGPEGAGLQDGRLADLAPTVLALMGLAPPEEMTGKVLLT
ncbi:MAG: 2,3-bisphosphoglycerate-independent phosphoglycerate mutase [Pseudomonadota bacterium]